jgi:hypothetical protein
MHALFNLCNDLLIGRVPVVSGSQSDFPKELLLGPNKFGAHTPTLRHMSVR